jgi:peptidoglycan hydrolase-like protein with peptidoglycan-binding domain
MAPTLRRLATAAVIIVALSSCTTDPTGPAGENSRQATDRAEPTTGNDEEFEAPEDEPAAPDSVAVLDVDTALVARSHQVDLEGAAVELSPGDSGPPVQRLQLKLVGVGLEPELDGEYGPETRAAVFTAQSNLGLEPTGVADTALLTALGASEPCQVGVVADTYTLGAETEYASAIADATGCSVRVDAAGARTLHPGWQCSWNDQVLVVDDELDGDCTEGAPGVAAQWNTDGFTVDVIAFAVGDHDATFFDAEQFTTWWDAATAAAGGVPVVFTTAAGAGEYNQALRDWCAQTPTCLLAPVDEFSPEELASSDGPHAQRAAVLAAAVRLGLSLNA